MPRLISESQLRRYWSLRDAGKSMRDACQQAGFSLTKAREVEKDGQKRRQHARMAKNVLVGTVDTHGAPKTREQLSSEAARALDDFPYFQRRYFGRKPMAWQEEAANQVVEWLLSPEEEYVVCNAPPGVGKTLLFTHDIPAWLIVRDRSIRTLLGAITGRLAYRYVSRLRGTLERTTPQQGKLQEVLHGDAFDAEATLAADYGRFRPLDSTLWTQEAFIVAQVGDVGITEKEPTCQGFGFDSEFIGNRVDFMNWDDLVNPRRQKTEWTVEQLRQEWDDQAETRLEPRGLLMLTGQRLKGNDLYRYALDKQVPLEVNADTGEVDEWKPKYHHLCFPAHFEDRCSPEHHLRGAKSYPEGCLLSTTRLSYTKLIGLKRNNPSFETVYQQKDVNPDEVLVPKDWIYGDNGFPGCVDRDRGRLEYPRSPDGACAWQPPLFSMMTVDPSPTKFWGIEWWVYQPSTEFRYLMDIEKRKMTAPEFLEWNPQTNQYSGLLEEWWQTSKRKGLRISHLVVEINAAQRFMLQYKFFNNWCALRGVQLIPHSTHRNKSDPEYGVWTVRDHFRFGRVRLPWKAHDEAKLPVSRFIAELTTYPASDTTDLVMAYWFFEFSLPKLYVPEGPPAKQWRPSWMAREPGRSYR